MTIQKEGENSKKALLSSALILAFAFFVSAFLSPKINEFTKSGLSLCFSVVIGSVFPFMLLTDLLVATAGFHNSKLIKIAFEKLFSINGAAISAFLCGIVCGFPIGVKVAADLYEAGTITKEECERLICFSNNTGPAFVISGIGVALLGSYRSGIIIYCSMVLSAVLIGILLGIGKSASHEASTQKKKDFSFVNSLKSATLSTLNISGFVVLFSIIFGLLSLFLKNRVIISLLSCFIEVSNAAKALALFSGFGNTVTASLISFAVSFSGLSVHLQAKSFLTTTDISMRKYYLMKLLQGVIAFFLTLIIIKAI